LLTVPRLSPAPAAACSTPRPWSASRPCTGTRCPADPSRRARPALTRMQPRKSRKMTGNGGAKTCGSPRPAAYDAADLAAVGVMCPAFAGRRSERVWTGRPRTQAAGSVYQALGGLSALLVSQEVQRVRASRHALCHPARSLTPVIREPIPELLTARQPRCFQSADPLAPTD